MSQRSNSGEEHPRRRHTGLSRASNSPDLAWRALPHGHDPHWEEAVVDLRENPMPRSPNLILQEVIHARAADDLRGKLVIVTGASEGVGRYLALALLDQGARVCVIGRDVAGLRETASLARADWPIVYLPCDLGNLTEVDEVVEFIERFDRPVDLVILAGAIEVRGDFASGALEDLDEQYLVNVRGPYALARRLLGQLQTAKGHIVFLNGVEPGTVGPQELQYSMTMAALTALAQGLSNELASSDIRVSTAYVPAAFRVASTKLSEDEQEQRSCQLATSIVSSICEDPQSGVSMMVVQSR